MSVDGVLADTKRKMTKGLEALERELSSVRAGKANAAMLDGVRVDYYGSTVPLNQVASINVPEARLLVVQPWEKTMVQPISKAIQSAALGLNPTDDGTVVRIPIPPLTEERRKELVKKVKAIGEQSKVTLRQVRREANDQLKKHEADKEISEDEHRRGNDEVQKITDANVTKIDEILARKESEILEI